MEREKTNERIEFFVMGEPVPQGSMKAFYIQKAHKTVTTHSNEKELKSWRSRIATEAQKARMDWEYSVTTTKGETPRIWDTGGAFSMILKFVLRRPKSLSKKIIYPIKRPDLDKLTRASGDAMENIIYDDDSQIIKWFVEKVYSNGEAEGVNIVVERVHPSVDGGRKP